MQQTTETITPLLIRVGEAAKLIQVSRAKAYQMASSGELPTVKFGGSIRVNLQALRKIIERDTVAAA